MRLLVTGLILALLATAAYLVGGLIRPTPAPSTPPTPEETRTVCPSTTTTITIAPALWQRRGDPCPNVVTTTAGGGEST